MLKSRSSKGESHEFRTAFGARTGKSSICIVRFWVHLGILPEDDVNKRNKSLDYSALIRLSARIGKQVEQRDRELLAAQSSKFKAWYTSEELAHNKMMAMTEIDNLGAISDAEFARCRVGDNGTATPPAQNSGVQHRR